jgi:hypothetical protein
MCGLLPGTRRTCTRVAGSSSRARTPCYLSSSLHFSAEPSCSARSSTSRSSVTSTCTWHLRLTVSASWRRCIPRARTLASIRGGYQITGSSRVSTSATRTGRSSTLPPPAAAAASPRLASPIPVPTIAAHHGRGRCAGRVCRVG